MISILVKSTFVLCLFISTAVFSAEYNGFRCIPSLRQTRIQVLETEKAIELRVTNPDGYDFMPQFDSSASAFSIPFMKMQAEDLKSLGEVFIFSWGKDKCRLNSSQFEVSCQGEALNKSSDVAAWGVTTTKITEEIDKDVYKKRRFRIAVENENTYFINLEFYNQNCETFD